MVKKESGEYIVESKEKLTHNPRTYFIATIIGILLYLVLDIIAQMLPPHYNFITQAESDLAVGPYGYVMAINFLIRGLFSLSFIIGLIITFKSGKSRYTAGLILLGIWTVGAFILAFFPADITLPSTMHGIIHGITAIAVFLGGSLGILIISIRMRTDDKFKDIIKYLIPLSIISVISLAFSPILVHIFGLIERIFLASILLWILIVSIHMLKKK
jgi:hypothetical protein